jgi:hypothetical protein
MCEEKQFLEMSIENDLAHADEMKCACGYALFRPILAV